MDLPLGDILRRTGPALDLLLPTGGPRVLAAVSGGADSLALVQILLASGRAVVVAHVNHQMRGQESEGDEAHVRGLCESSGLEFDSRRVQVLGESNVEANARSLRYQALEEMASLHRCASVATGHTASDALETILLHWLRGATVAGMRGIEPRRAIRPGSPIQLVRPMLDVTRRECESVCDSAGWAWREDASNCDPKYLRNRVRRELVPLLAEMMSARGQHAGASERVARQSVRAARLWADDLDFLDGLAREQLESVCVRRLEGLAVLDGEALLALAVPLQRRVLRLGAQQVLGSEIGVEDAEISSRKVEEARLWMAARGRRRVWQWRRNLRVEWCGSGSGNRIRFSRVELEASG